MGLLGERRAGWYWLRRKTGEWQVWEWRYLPSLECWAWQFAGSDYPGMDEDFAEIGPRIMPPGAAE